MPDSGTGADPATLERSAGFIPNFDHNENKIRLSPDFISGFVRRSCSNCVSISKALRSDAQATPGGSCAAISRQTSFCSALSLFGGFPSSPTDAGSLARLVRWRCSVPRASKITLGTLFLPTFPSITECVFDDHAKYPGASAISGRGVQDANPIRLNGLPTTLPPIRVSRTA